MNCDEKMVSEINKAEVEEKNQVKGPVADGVVPDIWPITYASHCYCINITTSTIGTHPRILFTKR